MLLKFIVLILVPIYAFLLNRFQYCSIGLTAKMLYNLFYFVDLFCPSATCLSIINADMLTLILPESP